MEVNLTLISKMNCPENFLNSEYKIFTVHLNLTESFIL